MENLGEFEVVPDDEFDILSQSQSQQQSSSVSDFVPEECSDDTSQETDS